MTWATGAAVAVRHERRRHEKRSTAACPRPTELNLPTSPMSYSSSPILPQTSPSGGVGIPEIYICKFQVPLLQIIVVSLVLGAILLIVGLVQLKPGAEASQHKFLLLGSGIFLLIFGIILAFIRCCLLPWTVKQKRRKLLQDEETALQNGIARTRTPSHTSLQTPSHLVRPTPTLTTTTSVVPPHHHHHHGHHQKTTSANQHHGKGHSDNPLHHGDDKDVHTHTSDIHAVLTPNGDVQHFDTGAPHPSCSMQVASVGLEMRASPPHCVLLVTEPSPSKDTSDKDSTDEEVRSHCIQESAEETHITGDSDGISTEESHKAEESITVIVQYSLSSSCVNDNAPSPSVNT